MTLPLNAIYGTKIIGLDAVRHPATKPFQVDASQSIWFFENSSETDAYARLPKPIRGCRLMVVNRGAYEIPLIVAPPPHSVIINYGGSSDRPGTLLEPRSCTEFISDGADWFQIPTMGILLADDSDILLCGHCGKPLYGCHPTGRNYRVYKCGSVANTGKGSCGNYEIREELILPKVFRMLDNVVKDFTTMLPSPPEEKVHPRKHDLEKRKEMEKDAEQLKQKINRTTDILLITEDKTTQRNILQKLTLMQSELAGLEAKLNEVQPVNEQWTNKEAKALGDWWEKFGEKAASVPIFHPHKPIYAFHYDPMASEDEPALLLDPLVLNKYLHEMGVEVRLWWKTTEVELQNGKTQNRYAFTHGTMKLGQSGKPVKFRKLRGKDSQ